MGLRRGGYNNENIDRLPGREGGREEDSLMWFCFSEGLFSLSDASYLTLKMVDSIFNLIAQNITRHKKCYQDHLLICPTK